jgi:hypothetical protein
MNSSLYHKFLDISIIPTGLNPIEANKPLWGTVVVGFGSNILYIKVHEHLESTLALHEYCYG